MALLDTLVADVAENVLRGSVHKAVEDFVTKGWITPAQVPELEAGIMDEIQVGLAIWQAAQKS